MKLSINLNKVALLRNSRGEDYPNIEYFANKAIDLGVDGLTLHPRPDHRHATSKDVINLAKLSKERGVEFNQITSDHGWLSGIHDNDLKNIIKSLKDSSNSNISLFIDNKDGVEYASVMGANLIEIHTGKFSKGIEENELSVVTEIQEIIDCALDSNLLVNAGHDLNLNNLHYLVEMGNINEVSIGHAIIIDSLHYGFEETISKYLDIIRN